MSNEKNIRKLTETEKKDLKNTFLLMTQEIDMVCKKYGIKMFLVGGSLLGAVRHGGFIPWDDDIDFGMKRCDYQKFIEIFDSELGDRYYLRCPNSKYPNGNRFMQIYKRGTTLKVAEGSTPLQPNCVLIDVFPYDYVPDNKLLRILKGIYCNFLMLIAASVDQRILQLNKRYQEIYWSNEFQKKEKMKYYLNNLIHGRFNQIFEDLKFRHYAIENFTTAANIDTQIGGNNNIKGKKIAVYSWQICTIR